MPTEPLVLVTGNTYPVREQLAALGGKWDAVKKGWHVAQSRAEEARRLVAAAPVSRPINRRRVRTTAYGWICPACEEENRHGSSACWECGCSR